MEGYIKLHRQSIDSRVFSDDFLWRLWCWCLLRANWKHGWKGDVEIPPGAFITGEFAASEQLGVSGSKWRRGMKKLQDYGMIRQKATNRFTLVFVCNWAKFQDERRTDDEQMTNKRRTDDEPVTTIEEGKELKERKERKEISDRSISNRSVEVFVDFDLQSVQELASQLAKVVQPRSTQNKELVWACAVIANSRNGPEFIDKACDVLDDVKPRKPFAYLTTWMRNQLRMEKQEFALLLTEINEHRLSLRKVQS